MPTRNEERVRTAMRNLLERGVLYHGSAPEYAVVVQTDPVQAQRATDDTELTEGDDLLFGHTVKQYDVDYGIAEGDTLVMHLMEDGNYAVVDVLHDRDVVSSAGGAPSGPAGGDLTGNYPDPEIAPASVGLPELSAAGTPDGSTFLRGDNTWASLPPAGTSSYEHTQSVAADVWLVTHNLGRHPSVTVEDSAHEIVIAQVDYIDDNSLTISFVGATAGWAYLV